MRLEVDPDAVEPYRLGMRPMRWGCALCAAEQQQRDCGHDWRRNADRSVLHVTPHVTLRDIPDDAHAYIVNGRSPLDWARDRLYIRQDKESGIVNDPNAWFADEPARLIDHLRRLIALSVETVRIVRNLPPSFPQQETE